ncbi:MAG: hypothetical protein KatS3mg065_1133 [Chloroflexota bacterium]|nr:MAG: hypothetical protein KatS3mg065_1133 [Chloroflexota bacterium]
MIAAIEGRRSEMQAICRHFGVSRLEVFGSAATSQVVAETGDLDFLVEFAPPVGPGYADRYFGLLKSPRIAVRAASRFGRRFRHQEPVLPILGRPVTRLRPGRREIMAKRDEMIEKLEKRMRQRTNVEPLFTIRWSVV